MTRDHTNDHDTNIRAALKTIEDEVLELKKQEFDLLTQLRLLRDTIGRKCMLARKLKNSLVPVNRLPDEILLSCFGKAVQEWMDKNNGADERVFARSRWSYTPKDFRLPRTPVFAISHVSQRWRQLAITAPSLWTNLIITPKFQRHSDVFREFLYRANGMPIALNFRFLFRLEGTLSSDAVLTHAQQIKSITFLASGPVLSYLLSQAVEQTITGPTNPSSITFNCLTELSIFGLHYSDGLTFSRLRQLLSATPHLKTLELQHDVTLNHEERVDEERADRAEISLPKLENLTIINSSLLAFKFLDSLSAPSVHQLKLLVWDPGVSFDATSCLFIPDSDNDDDNLGLPKFPSVQKLTLSCSYDFEVLDADLISAFVQITHLTLCTPRQFYPMDEPDSPALPTFHQLQRLVLDFAFERAGDLGEDLGDRFTWLPKPREDHPLLISVFDRSTMSMRDADKNLFRYYQELQQYGTLDESSSRLREFVRWQAQALGPSSRS